MGEDRQAPWPADARARELHLLILAAAQRDGAADRRWAAGVRQGGFDAVAMREQAELERQLASTDRAQFRVALYAAQAGRPAAARDRYAADLDRRAARRDRRMAQADRSAAAKDQANGWTEAT
ncbi:hypothetical protein ACIBCO_33770 [Streptomyces violascens]|uniref:hypothetical protein n=1 Tax=Streptomyces violascens TaxID=67381 RepID=UPI003792C7CC